MKKFGAAALELFLLLLCHALVVRVPRCKRPTLFCVRETVHEPAAKRRALLQHGQPRLYMWQSIKRDTRHSVCANPRKGSDVGDGKFVTAQKRPGALAAEALLHDFKQASRLSSVSIDCGPNALRHEPFKCDALTKHLWRRRSKEVAK